MTHEDAEAICIGVCRFFHLKFPSGGLISRRGAGLLRPPT
jgi:hypothetical protein